jgi:exodeoxyribonuclease V
MKRAALRWSPQQADALTAIETWLRGDNPKQVFRLFGYAGTGKTTLAKVIANLCASDKVLLASLTGKAALVLQRSVGRPASTLHRLVYYGSDEARSTKSNLSFTLRAPADCQLTGAALLICDEVSMVAKDLGQDILSFGTPVLALGDPGQLPPINGAGFFTNSKPDVMLTEIHRQAKDDPIIELADAYHNGLLPNRGVVGDVSIVGAKEISNAALLSADVIICGTHRTRRSLNKRMRKLLRSAGQLPNPDHPARADLPVVGDRVICRRNRWDRWLLNGSLWQVTDVEFGVSNGVDMAHMMLKSVDEPEPHEVCVDVPIAWFREDEHLLDDDALRELHPDEFRFGYAITCHSAQGSQWNSVLVIDEGAVFGTDAPAWRYTACTRAIKRLTVGVFYR